MLAHIYAAARVAANRGRITGKEVADLGDQLRTTISALEGEYRALLDDQEELTKVKAELAAILALEPVDYQFQARDGTWAGFIDERHRLNTLEDGTWPIRAVYVLPEKKK